MRVRGSVREGRSLPRVFLGAREGGTRLGTSSLFPLLPGWLPSPRMAGVGAWPPASGAGARGHIEILRETIPDDDAEAAKVGGYCVIL